MQTPKSANDFVLVLPTSPHLATWYINARISWECNCVQKEPYIRSNLLMWTRAWMAHRFVVCGTRKNAPHPHICSQSISGRFWNCVIPCHCCTLTEMLRTAAVSGKLNEARGCRFTSFLSASRLSFSMLQRVPIIFSIYKCFVELLVLESDATASQFSSFVSSPSSLRLRLRSIVMRPSPH